MRQRDVQVRHRPDQGTRPLHRPAPGRRRPAKALLDTVGANPASLIVVGNRGLGASQGQLLGSVPGNVVKNAICDVLVVQTSALDEERPFRAELAVADNAGDGARPLSADPD